MISNKQIKKLLEYTNDKYPITSLYLKLGPSDRVNYQYKTKLKNLIKDIKSNISETSMGLKAMESVEKDLKKIVNFVDNNDKLTECRGLSIFSDTKSKFWKVFKLPIVYRNQLIVDRSPHLGQLIKIIDDYKNIVTVLVDRKKARIFRLQLEGCNEIFDYFYPEASRTKKFKSTEGKFNQRLSPTSGTGSQVQGYGEHSFHRTIDNEIHQHYKYVADKVLYAFKENKFDFLVLGGTEKNISEFSHHLHSYLKQRLVGTIRADVTKSKPSQIAEMTIDTFRTYNITKGKNILKEFEEKLATRLAVNGFRPTLKALSRGQVKTILIEESFSSPLGNEPMEVVYAVDQAIEEASRQNSEIEILSGRRAGKIIDGIGAILRFK